MRQGWRMAAPAQNVYIGGANPEKNESAAVQDMKRRREILGTIALFEPLTEDELDKLAGRLNSLSFLAGSIVTRQGDVGDCLFILTRGQADVLLQANDHSRRLATLGSGQVMGEMSLMTGEPRRATLKARTDVDCYTLTKDGFEEILQLRPELAEPFAQLLAQRSQELQDVRNTMPAAQVAAKKADILARMRRMFGLSGRV
jgi:CRP-like cAMP-binding protein